MEEIHGSGSLLNAIIEVKGQVYMACIRSCLLYGCETWAMRAELESKITYHVLEAACCMGARHGP